MNVEPIETLGELKQQIQELVTYCYADEGQDYADSQREGNTGPHIFETIERLRLWAEN